MTLPAEAKIELGKAAKIAAAPPPGTKIRWLHAPDLDGCLQIFEYDDHVVVNALAPGEFYLGADTAEASAVWTKVTVSGGKSSIDFSWVGKLIPSWSTLSTGAKQSAIMGLGALLLWLVTNWGHIPWPTPGPGPTPPGPTPTPVPPAPTPAPIPGDGFRVLIVYETGDLSKLSKAQLDALYGADFRAYLNAVCATGADGKTKEWRIWDKDIDTSGETKLWQNAMKDALANPSFKTPYAVISTGKTGYSGPLPEGDLIAWIEQWEGK